MATLSTELSVKNAPTNAKPAALPMAHVSPASTLKGETLPRDVPVFQDTMILDQLTAAHACLLASPATTALPAPHAMPPSSECSMEPSALA